MIRITQTLLSAWKYSFITDSGYEDFLNALNRVKTPQTKQMLDGIRFEGCVNAALDGAPVDESHEWYKVIVQLRDYLQGARQQVTLFAPITVDGEDYLLHGVLDYLKAGIIYDTKFSATYGSNGRIQKYLRSPQTAAYLYLVPEAQKMEYIISDGKYVYREDYTRDDIEPIERTISQFIKYVRQRDLYPVLAEEWSVKE